MRRNGGVSCSPIGLILQRLRFNDCEEDSCSTDDIAVDDDGIDCDIVLSIDCDAVVEYNRARRERIASM